MIPPESIVPVDEDGIPFHGAGSGLFDEIESIEGMKSGIRGLRLEQSDPLLT